ncbi:hypothetical protein [Methylotenera sp.]|uniref:hypothetical protein n=1 Tax=Methylotenera sp. TaxID=2051956 RepID=UPI0025F53BA6|nr:hypothetical protein [Methylotenera sp.]
MDAIVKLNEFQQQATPLAVLISTQKELDMLTVNIAERLVVTRELECGDCV